MNLAIYTNILTPYRTYFYNIMYEECKKRGDNFYVILMSDTESNRTWRYDDYKTTYTILLKHKTISYKEMYIHFNSNLKNVLKKLRLDVLICAGGYLCPGIWKALKLKDSLKYKIYFWSESHLNEEKNYDGFKVAMRELLRKKVYKRFDGFWYAGKLSREFIETYYRHGADMFYMPNLIEEEKYKAASYVTEQKKIELRNKYEVSDENVVLLCPARLSPVKGIDRLVPILAAVETKRNFTLMIAGDGELKYKIDDLAKKGNVDVRLLGFRSQKDMIELYSLADIFILPSLSDPNPLTCIEALWARLPLFISQHCGNYPEVVVPGENGYVFDYKNQKKMIEQLEKIIDADVKWVNRAKEISGKIAKHRYDSKKVVNQVLDYFQKYSGDLKN